MGGELKNPTPLPLTTVLKLRKKVADTIRCAPGFRDFALHQLAETRHHGGSLGALCVGPAPATHAWRTKKQMPSTLKQIPVRMTRAKASCEPTNEMGCGRVGQTAPTIPGPPGPTRRGRGASKSPQRSTFLPKLEGALRRTRPTPSVPRPAPGPRAGGPT